MNTQTRIARRLGALLVSCAALVFMSMSTPPASATTDVTAKPPAKVQLTAKLLDAKVKVNAKARIHGRLDVQLPSQLGAARGLELIVVQQLKAGVWVDLNLGSCRPNATFKLRVSFSVAAEYTLRVYHPATVLYASAHTDAFLLAVIP